jgi:hypothetical protein
VAAAAAIKKGKKFQINIYLHCWLYFIHLVAVI